MRLIADRFAADKSGHTCDLATGERVHIITTPMGGESDQAQWAERCAWLSRASHPSMAPLVDFGVLDERHRFEAWAAHPGWTGSPRAAATARSHVAQFLGGCRRTPVSSDHVLVGTRHGRPSIIPDARAGCESATDVGPSTCERGVLGVVRDADPRVQRAGELLSVTDGGRLIALSLWSPTPEDDATAVRQMARVARLAGYVPMSSRLCRSPWAELAATRTLAVFASGAADDGWRLLLTATLMSARPHVVLFVGSHAVRRVHMVSPTRWSADALVSTVQPERVAHAHRRSIVAAARRSAGYRDAFERLLFGRASSIDLSEAGTEEHVFESSRPQEPGEHTRGARAAEHTTPYLVHQTARPAVARGERTPCAWPAPSEVIRFRRLAESGRALLARGRHQAGDRALRQAMHAFSRRSEWVSAVESALAAAASLLARGLLRDAAETLEHARAWGSRSNDLGLVTRVAVATASLRLEQGHLVDAECVLETALEAAMSEGSARVNETALALVRCLYWQGRYADAWHRLDLVADAQSGDLATAGASDERAVDVDSVRAWILRARVAIGRGRAADAVACAARARDGAARSPDLALQSSAWYASALAQLAAGDAGQSEAAAVHALRTARAAHQPLLALRARLVRAEVARRRGQRTPAAILVKRVSRLVASLPHTLRARVELLRDLLTDADVAVTDKRARLSGLPALRLFAASAVAPLLPPPTTSSNCCSAARPATTMG
ncbi:MAG: hypothetical protein U0Q11_19645 [Vicinamibacterales bacterium]